MVRRIAALAALSVLLAACGAGEGTVFTVPAGAGSTSTSSTGVADASSSSTTTAGTTLAPALSDVVVWQVLQRWDGSRPMGSFEATVCNLGQGPAAGLEAVIAANGVEARVSLPEISARGCVDAYDPESTFESFGVTEGQTVTVRAEVRSDGAEVAAREETLVVDLFSAAPSPELLADYHWCMGSNGPVHGNCVALNARAAFADPHEVAKQGGRYVVILPAGWEPLAAMTLADMAICLPRIEEYLGIDLPGYASPLVWRYSESNGYSWFGAGAGIQQITPAAQDFYQGVLDGQFTQHSWESIFRGLCSEAHEPTHVTVDSAMGLPHWLNEGLATYMGHPDRVGWYLSPDRRCTETGYYTHELDGTEIFIPYVPLEVDPAVPDTGGPYYVTGACFWEYFESAFGHDAFLSLMDALEATREGPGDPFQGCPKFLDLVAPIIGEDISPLTQERFGFGPDYGRCRLG